MAIPNPSSNPAQPAPNLESDWSWLRSRLESATGAQATLEFSEWIGQQLELLEGNYADMVTGASRKLVAGELVKVRR